LAVVAVQWQESMAFYPQVLTAFSETPVAVAPVDKADIHPTSIAKSSVVREEAFAVGS
jgi:hypothetical protein